MTQGLTGQARQAVRAAEAAIPYLEPGPPLRTTPHGAVELPILYHGAAIDRLVLDPCSLTPLPKGMPEPPWGRRCSPGSGEELVEAASRIIGELEALPGAEYRGPEAAWAVPLAWRSLIVVHIRVRVGPRGPEVVPDEPLTLDLMRRLGRL